MKSPDQTSYSLSKPSPLSSMTSPFWTDSFLGSPGSLASTILCSLSSCSQHCLSCSANLACLCCFHSPCFTMMTSVSSSVPAFSSRVTAFIQFLDWVVVAGMGVLLLLGADMVRIEKMWALAQPATSLIDAKFELRQRGQTPHCLHNRASLQPCGLAPKWGILSWLHQLRYISQPTSAVSQNSKPFPDSYVLPQSRTLSCAT